jgi:hypothetical protein
MNRPLAPTSSLLAVTLLAVNGGRRGGKTNQDKINPAADAVCRSKHPSDKHRRRLYPSKQTSG